MDEVDIMRMLTDLADNLPPQLVQFLDMDSRNMIEEKARVLDELKDGTPISEISGFYDILELYPRDTEKDGIITKTLWF